MSATFFYAVRYLIDGNCVTPLRVAGADGDPETVLTDADGVAFGAGQFPCRRDAQLVGGKQGGAALAEALFGSQKHPGSLLFSDARFAADAPRAVRPAPAHRWQTRRRRRGRKV